MAATAWTLILGDDRALLAATHYSPPILKPTNDSPLEALQERLARIPGLTLQELEAEHVAILGRKSGELTGFLKTLVSRAPEERRELGARANQLKAQFEAAFVARRAELEALAADQHDAGVDLTMPARRTWVACEHPVTQVTEEIVSIFEDLGFVRARGPEAESEWYNFVALNFPADHPAMDMQDTLYLDSGDRRNPFGDRRRGRTSGIEKPHERRSGGVDRRKVSEGRILLRTHTSPVQIRTLLAERPPVRVVIPGLAYRKDAFDASHAPAFLQVEGLVVDDGISFVDLKGTLMHFARRFFSPTVRVRFRPSFFPFTEPSAEMEIGCLICQGSGCPACKGTGLMEILGCGMVHPAVLENCGLDSETYTGFAFGMGPHRIALLRYGVPDIRMFFDSDMRFLSQFAVGMPA